MFQSIIRKLQTLKRDLIDSMLRGFEVMTQELLNQSQGTELKKVQNIP